MSHSSFTTYKTTIFKEYLPQFFSQKIEVLERVGVVETPSSAWKAGVLADVLYPHVILSTINLITIIYK